jgi:hypothetical protein
MAGIAPLKPAHRHLVLPTFGRYDRHTWPGLMWFFNPGHAPLKWQESRITITKSLQRYSRTLFSSLTKSVLCLQIPYSSGRTV